MENLKLQRKRERKRLKRLRQENFNSGNFESTIAKIDQFQSAHDTTIISKHRQNSIYEFLREKKMINGSDPEPMILIPKKFSLSDNYNETIGILGRIADSLYSEKIHATALDFTYCNYTDLATLFFLQVIHLEFVEYAALFNQRLMRPRISAEITIEQSNNREVNRLLFMAGLSSNPPLLKEGDMIPVHTTGYLKGNKAQRHYQENRKGKVTTQIVQYLDKCLFQHNLELNPEGRNELDGIISEVLNNAEDHSPFRTWYVTASLSRLSDPNSGNLIGELNLAFLNFGFSFYEGFLKTKEENNLLFSQLEAKVDNLLRTYPSCSLSKESLFTLYALQEGISRLKHENESRGTGTMRFIRAMLGIGDFEDARGGYRPKLIITTGTTRLICDNQYKPFNKNGVFLVSLNPQNDLSYPPEKSHLQDLKSFFPGTLLIIRLFLNEEHLIFKINGNGR